MSLEYININNKLEQETGVGFALAQADRATSAAER
jgi:hypothetical protein